MTVSPGKYAYLVLLAGILVTLAILGQMGGAAGERESWPPEYLVNRIAVATSDGQIRSYQPDGRGERRVSAESGYFTWPTWAPDGRSMVYSGVVENADGRPVTTLFLYESDTGESRALYESAPGFAGLLADGVVHYPLWSPDGGRLAFIAATQERGLTLFMDDPWNDEEPEYILDRGPLWMSWSLDSAKLAVHRGEDHFVVGAEDAGQVSRASFRSNAYRVPGWTPGLDEFNAVKGLGGPAFGLYSAPASGVGSERLLTGVGANAAFLWAADGSGLAVADDVRPILYGNTVLFVYRQLRVLDSANFEVKAEVEENVVAYFWSPDSSRIAYVTLVGPSGGLRWSVLDVATGASSPLAEFLPSPDQLTMFQFFDQYAYSHRLWSPDSRYLLFAGTLNETAVAAAFGGQSNRVSQVFIVDTGPTRSALPVAEGTLGFWSPV